MFHRLNELKRILRPRRKKRGGRTLISKEKGKGDMARVIKLQRKGKRKMGGVAKGRGGVVNVVPENLLHLG